MTIPVDVRLPIKLGQFLKVAGIVDTGADATLLIGAGDVSVDGEIETRRGRQLHGGEVVALRAEALDADEPAEFVVGGGASGQLTVSRTVAGGVQEITIDLAVLPDEEQAAWRELLANRDLQDLDAAALDADGPVYGITSADAGVDVQLPRPALPDGAAELVDLLLDEPE